MGWKGSLRSLNAASNRIIKAQQREINKQLKERARISKKIGQIEERKHKIFDSLKSELASGKIDQGRYKELYQRIDDIPLELLVFGKTPGVSLGKRYICGKIEKDEFLETQQELIPPDLYIEMDIVKHSVNSIQDNIIYFKKSLLKSNNTCEKCGKKKSFFTRLYNVDTMTLCSNCKSQFNTLSLFRGFDGKYISIQSFIVTEQTLLNITIKEEHY